MIVNPQVSPQDLHKMDLMDLYIANVVLYVNRQNEIVAMNQHAKG